MLDTHIPSDFMCLLEARGNQVERARDAMPDWDIVKQSKQERSIIITMDNDFGSLVFANNQRPFGIIFVKIHPFSRRYSEYVVDRIAGVLADGGVDDKYIKIGLEKLKIVEMNDIIAR